MCSGQEWIQELGEDQKRREYWVFATVGQEHIQFWRLDAKRPFAAYSKKTWRTPMYSFSLDLDNVGFQLFSRWLQTPLEVWQHTLRLVFVDNVWIICHLFANSSLLRAIWQCFWYSCV